LKLSRNISKATISHDEEVQAAMTKQFQEQPVKFYTTGFEKLV
jgi:hypothetical protein